MRDGRPWSERTKVADVLLIPEPLWLDVLRVSGHFLLHHPQCDVIRALDCDCRPLFVGGLLVEARATT